jgi:hypothetical protein
LASKRQFFSFNQLVTATNKWQSQAEEWLYFHSGTARATVFTGGATARTFGFTAGDTAAFPDKLRPLHPEHFAN